MVDGQPWTIVIVITEKKNVFAQNRIIRRKQIALLGEWILIYPSVVYFVLFLAVALSQLIKMDIFPRHRAVAFHVQLITGKIKKGSKQKHSICIYFCASLKPYCSSVSRQQQLVSRSTLTLCVLPTWYAASDGKLWWCFANCWKKKSENLLRTRHDAHFLSSSGERRRIWIQWSI